MFRKILFAVALGVSLASVSSTALAACGSCNAGCNACSSSSDPCGTVCCPRCDCVCKLKAEMVDVDKHCWKVECEKICVPKFVFPWQKSCCDPCANNGAWTREINVLVKHDYTCPECEYSWSPKDATCDCDKCCNNCPGGCDPCCAEAVEATAPAVPTPADAGPSLDIPPAPPAPSASKQNMPKVRVAKAAVKRHLKTRTTALQAALQKLRK